MSSGHFWISFNTEAEFQGSWCIWCSAGSYGWNRDDEITDQMLSAARVTEVIAYGEWHGRID